MELLAWQLGRVTSYTLVGTLAGAVGAGFLSLAPIEGLRHATMAFANLLLIALALHLLRVSQWVVRIEQLGAHLWKWIAPLAARSLTPAPVEGLLPPPPLWRTMIRAGRIGLIWGWLPCGLVYTMVITASVSGGAGSGALWMLGFGLGTIPALWLTSMTAGQWRADGPRADTLRRAAGILILVFGLWGLARAVGIAPAGWVDAFCITP
jgi:sulfite exporter TauE/SafE